MTAAPPTTATPTAAPRPRSRSRSRLTRLRQQGANWLGATGRDWIGSEGERWLFVARTLIASFCALWLAYRLGLDSPGTAMTTTIILALPSSGMVLEKSFYRLLGTLVGCAAALALIGAFPQQPVLLFAGLALWVGLCTSGSALYRNAQSYSFVLSGYTACMIVLPAVEQPALVFSLAVTRVAEVGLGIICSAAASAVLLPRHQSTQVMRTVQARYTRFIGFCHDALAHTLAPADIELTQLQFAADIAALESGRSAAIFEVIQTREHHRQLHAFNASFMQALTTLYTLHRLLRRSGDTPGSNVPALTAPLQALLAGALDTSSTNADMAHVAAQFDAAVQAARSKAGTLARLDAIDFDTAVELLQRFTRQLHQFQRIYRALVHGERQPGGLPAAPAYMPTTPRGLVLAGGLRAAAAVAILAGGAYLLAWPHAGTAMLMAIVFCALASSSPRPSVLIRQVLTGFLLAWPMSLVCVFFVMPHADGFVMLALSMAPFLAIGVYLIGDPKRAGIGLGIGTFLTQQAPANMLRLDGAAFMNSCLALSAGLLLSYLIFAAILPGHTMGHKDHVAAALWREALNACLGAPRRLQHRFNNRVRDLLSQLNAAAGPAPGAETRAVVRQALMLLELGHAVIELRGLIATSNNSPASDALRASIKAIAAYLRAPGAPACTAALETLLQAGTAVRASVPDASAARQLRLQVALTDLHSMYTCLLDPLHAPGQQSEKKIPHAA